MDEQRDRRLGPLEPLRPAVTDHAFESVVDLNNPIARYCTYPEPGTGDLCRRTQVEHARSW